MEYILITGNFFVPSGFADSARPAGLDIGIASNVLSVTQQVTVRQIPIRLSASSQLNLSQQAYQRNVKLSAGNFLNLQHQVARPKFAIATSFLFMTQLGRTVLWEQLSQQIDFNQSANSSNGISNSMGIQQTVNVNVVKHISVTQTFGVQSKVAVFNPKDPDPGGCI
jgi:hypothetical protein